jgi:hypothetical protein
MIDCLFLIMENRGYSEWVPTGALVKSLFVGFSAYIVIFTLAIFLFTEVSLDTVYGLVFGWGILAFLLFLFWNYRGLKIQVSSKELSVAYGLFNRKSFLLKDIVSCKKTKASFGRYWGVGVRYGSDGSVAYTTSFGDAVEVAPKAGRVFVFSSKKPYEVCEVIKRNTQNGA